MIKNQVFWHGVFPDRARTGRIVRRGSIRHEVLWDGATETSLEAPSALMLVSRHPKCCTYCKKTS